jgi:polyhydroxyalkanoate synthesis regulator phasin
MNTKRLRTSVAAAMGGAVLLAGLLVGASFALAQETEEPDVTVESDAPDRARGARDDARRWVGNLEGIAEEFGTTLDELKAQLAGGATLDDIATDLGIDMQDVVERLRQEALDAIDQQVADGNLTQERADSIKERIESFDLEDGFPFGKHGPRGEAPEGFDDEHRGSRGFVEGLDLGGFRGHHGDGFEFFGDLDIDLEELRGLLSSGMSLDDALSELGIDVDSLIAEAQEAALAHIDERVAAGEMTQDQADQLKEMIEGFDISEGFPFGMRGFGSFDLRGFPHHQGEGFFDGAPDDVNAEGALRDA